MCNGLQLCAVPAHRGLDRIDRLISIPKSRASPGTSSLAEFRNLTCQLDGGQPCSPRPRARSSISTLIRPCAPCAGSGFPEAGWTWVFVVAGCCGSQPWCSWVDLPPRRGRPARRRRNRRCAGTGRSSTCRPMYWTWQGTRRPATHACRATPYRATAGTSCSAPTSRTSPYPPNLKANFKRDRLTGETETFYGATAEPPVISADGNHIAFQSCEPWLRPDHAPICDIYIVGSRGLAAILQREHHGRRSVERQHERGSGPERRWALPRVSHALDHAAPARDAARPALVIRDRDLDGNGVFDEPGPDGSGSRSSASRAETNPATTSAAAPRSAPTGGSLRSGRCASNLVPGDTNNAWDVFLRDRAGAGTTRRINVGWDGQQATPTLDSPAISMDESGDLIAFATDDTYLVNPPTHGIPDTNNGLDIAVYDRLTNTLERINIGAGPDEQGNGHTYWPTFSENGRYISLVSTSTNVAGPPRHCRAARHVYVHDRITTQTTRVEPECRPLRGRRGQRLRHDLRRRVAQCCSPRSRTWCRPPPG